MTEHDEFDEMARKIVERCGGNVRTAEEFAAALRAAAKREAELRQEIDRLDHEADLNCKETVALSHEVAALCATGKLEAELRVDNELELSRQRVVIADLKDKLAQWEGLHYGSDTAEIEKVKP